MCLQLAIEMWLVKQGSAEFYVWPLFFIVNYTMYNYTVVQQGELLHPTQFCGWRNFFFSVQPEPSMATLTLLALHHSSMPQSIVIFSKFFASYYVVNNIYSYWFLKHQDAIVERGGQGSPPLWFPVSDLKL